MANRRHVRGLALAVAFFAAAASAAVAASAAHAEERTSSAGASAAGTSPAGTSPGGTSSAGTSPAPVACQPDADATGVVSAVTDGRTLALADGRELRLAAIEVPEVSQRPDDAEDAQAGLAAKAALTTLTAGKNILLKHLGSGADRYGRIVAHIFVGDGPEAWVQRALVAGGHALVSAHVGAKDCAAALLAAERDARTRKLGLWANSYYDIRGANDPVRVLADRGRFTLVEGKVVSVRDSGGTTYINFGRRWSEDFTVTVPKRYEKAFATAGVDAKALAGRRIRVRGYIEQRGGPWIEATAPEQIEIVAGD
jgi:endonuclease YncB( thermonuclease family)